VCMGPYNVSTVAGTGERLLACYASNRLCQ
jgi:hypothetical protein